jgi:uncharacterized surface protein with fasciclin (FAS1) repeats
MYKTSTPARRSAFAAAAAATLSLALAFSTSAIAGPGLGKPGQNDFVEGGTIIDIALEVNDGGAGEFNGLLSAVLCFGPLDDNPIVDLLNGTDKYTLFAPTDAAFGALLDRLEVADPCDLDSATLLTVLQYHVVDGRRFSNSVFNAYDSKVIETLAGVDIVSFVDEVDGPTLHDVDEQAVGVVADLININASNGVIHVVDTVLLPIDL